MRARAAPARARVARLYAGRLPRSNTIVFSVRTHLVSLADWCSTLQTGQNEYLGPSLRDHELVDYKCFDHYHDVVVAWLSRHDDDAPLATGYSWNPEGIETGGR
ncbi:hypothetical protein [Arthrobacter sp. CG_A4]|uniref:hypothetical protein n=1 Tax=Arthrobacter sp. CG_A4 TaxID=3071706 RepID=UPI002E150448